MKEPVSLIRPTDGEARTLARRLARGARFGAIAVIDPEDGHPHASRVLLATDLEGVPVVLASELALHTRAILSDPRCSLLVGEPGKGDPLAWPRLSIQAEAIRVQAGSESHACIKRRFLRRHTKAKLYVEFSDFSFFRLVPKSADLNGGFGKAYKISAADLIIHSDVTKALFSHELQVIAQILALGENVADSLVSHYFKEKTVNWEISGIDAQGMEFALGEKLLRLELGGEISDINGLIAVYKEILTGLR